MAIAHWGENLFVFALQYPKGIFTTKTIIDPIKRFIFPF